LTEKTNLLDHIPIEMLAGVIRGRRLAQTLVEHVIETMGADSALIPVDLNGQRYWVKVAPQEKP
jgi:hypothetical protein